MRKVQGGTRADDHICQRCTHGQVVRGTAESQELTVCHQGMAPRQQLFRVAECTKFHDSKLQDVWSFEKIATVITVDRMGKIGFLDPKKAKKLMDADELPELVVPDLEGV